METNKFIVRSVGAGVFYGEIVSRNGDEVEMRDAQCLWYWAGAAALNQLAMEGVKNPADCKFTMAVPKITILGVVEIIECAPDAVSSIESVPIWKI